MVDKSVRKKLKLLRSKVDAERLIMHGTRVTVPKRLRKRLNLKDGSVFEIRAEDERLILQLIKP